MSRPIFRVDDDVFGRVPGYQRWVVFAEMNKPSAQADARAAVMRAGAIWSGGSQPAGAADAIESWRKAFRAVGLDPTKTRPAIDALAKRAAQGNVPVTGLPMVDVGTAVSLTHTMPVGIHTLDDLDGDLVLGWATGAEVFVTFADDREAPAAGELVYKSGHDVLTRRWVWRQGRVGSATPSSTAFAINVDVLEGQRPEPALAELVELVESLGACVTGQIRLSVETPEAALGADVDPRARKSPAHPVSDKSSEGVLDDLQRRGLVFQCTDESGLRRALAKGQLTVYCGIDPTAPSLHVGSLNVLTMLRRFQARGHKPIVVLGGATGAVGDPSGRSNERVLMDSETLAINKAAIRSQVERLLPARDGLPDPVIVDNYDWTAPLGTLDYLRHVGKHFRIGEMLARDSVRSRLDSPQGLSYTEFSYSLLQALDFEHLFVAHGCLLQLGGSDQYGNIIAGIDLIRRRHGTTAYGLVWPLLTRSDGAKLGKTADGAVWLESTLTSPWLLWQYWMGLPDDDAGVLLHRFSMKSIEQIGSILGEHRRKPESHLAQRVLADEVVAWVHGEQALPGIHEAAGVLFNGASPVLEDPTVVAILARQLPKATLSPAEIDGLDAAGLAVKAGVASTRTEVHRLVSANGVLANGAAIVVDSPARALLTGGVVLFRRGKRNYRLVVVGPEDADAANGILAVRVGVEGVTKAFGDLTPADLRARAVSKRANAYSGADPHRAMTEGLVEAREWDELAGTIEQSGVDAVRELGVAAVTWARRLGVA